MARVGSTPPPPVDAAPTRPVDGQPLAVPDLTPRAVAAGLVLGAVFAAANFYMSLKTGWADTNNVSATILTFAFFASLRGKVTSLSPLETNVAQTVAAGACMAGMLAGLGSALTAYRQLGGSAPPRALAAWAALLPVAWVPVGLLFGRRALADPSLAFPTGIAVGELIRGLHAGIVRAGGRTRALLRASAFGGLVAWSKAGVPKLLPEMLTFPSARMVGTPGTAGVALSALMLGIGGLIGPRLAVSWCLGGALSWLGIVPRLVREGILDGASYGDAVSWLSWPAVGLMIGATAASFVADALARRTRRSAAAAAVSASSPVQVPAPPPRSWFVASGLAFVALALLATQVFGASTSGFLVAALVGVALVPVSLRSAGETDTTMTTLVALVAQMTLAITVGAGSPQLALLSTVAAAASLASANGCWALKAGQRLGARLERQAIAYAIGTIGGGLISAPLFAAITRGAAVGGPTFPAPGLQMAKATAIGIAHGVSALPPGAPAAALVGLVAGVLGRALQRFTFVPSPVAMGVGMIGPLPMGVTVAMGGLIDAAWRRARPRQAEENGSAVAGGLIVGEALVGVIAALMSGAGRLP